MSENFEYCNSSLIIYLKRGLIWAGRKLSKAFNFLNNRILLRLLLNSLVRFDFRGYFGSLLKSTQLSFLNNICLKFIVKPLAGIIKEVSQLQYIFWSLVFPLLNLYSIQNIHHQHHEAMVENKEAWLIWIYRIVYLPSLIEAIRPAWSLWSSQLEGLPSSRLLPLVLPSLLAQILVDFKVMAPYFKWVKFGSKFN